VTVGTNTAAKRANGSPVIIGCLAISTQFKEIYRVVLFCCSAVLRMDEHLFECAASEHRCEKKAYAFFENMSRVKDHLFSSNPLFICLFGWLSRALSPFVQYNT
jgi:hypothetical protein